MELEQLFKSLSSKLILPKPMVTPLAKVVD